MKKSIRKRRLSDVICDNVDVSSVPLDVFTLNSNGVKTCANTDPLILMYI